MGSVSTPTSETSPHPTIMAGKADPYADIDFEEINEQTNLANDEIKCLKVCFDLFDTKKQEFLSGDDLGDIMRAMGFRPSLRSWLNFCTRLTRTAPERLNLVSSASCAPPSWSDPDMETMKKELKDAFRVYDKEGQ